MFKDCCATSYQTTDISSSMILKDRNLTLTDADKNRIIEMAWEDRTPFEAIEFQFGLSEAMVIDLMRHTLKPGSFRLWRKRVNQKVSQKHLKKRNPEISRFKSRMQRTITFNKISKQ